MRKSQVRHTSELMCRLFVISKLYYSKDYKICLDLGSEFKYTDYKKNHIVNENLREEAAPGCEQKLVKGLCVCGEWLAVRNPVLWRDRNVASPEANYLTLC